jgi:hypothetical protein
MLTAPLPKYYQDLPSNFTRPGGNLVQIMISPMNITSNKSPGNMQAPDTVAPSRPYFFVSDSYTVFQMDLTIRAGCSGYHLNVSEPIPFNSTGDIQLGSVYQYYRGDSAAMLIQGYDNTKGVPSDTLMTAWGCFNDTIGQSIPLMDTDNSKVATIAVAVTLVVIQLLLLWWVFKQIHKKYKRRTKQYISIRS